MGHAYGITQVRVIHKIPMIHLRNPWFGGFVGIRHTHSQELRLTKVSAHRGSKEWNGAWSDGSREWHALSSSERRSLRLEEGDDGEFWMSFDDFCDNFTTLNICR